MEAAAKKTARHRVREGRAKSLSAFVSEAVDKKLRHDALQDILAAMAQEHGERSRTSDVVDASVVLAAREHRAVVVSSDPGLDVESV